MREKSNNNVIINNKIEFNLAEINDVDKVIKNSRDLFKNLYQKTDLELEYQKNGNVLTINKIIIKNIEKKDKDLNLNVLQNRVIKTIKNAINNDIKRKYQENPGLYYEYLKESTLLNLYNGIEDLKEYIEKEDIEAIKNEATHLGKFIHYSLSKDLAKFKNILNNKLNTTDDKNIIEQKIKDEFDNIFFEIKRSEDKLDFLLNFLHNYEADTDKDMIKNIFNEVKNLDETIENSLNYIYINYLKIENDLLKKELEKIKKKLTNKQDKTMNTKPKTNLK